jgi:PAS domain S-box-containing protein
LRRTWQPYLLRLTVLLLIYVAAGKLGLRLAFVNASATAVWAPTGVALAACILYGGQMWPAILLGAFLVNVTTSGSVPASAVIAIGNTLEAIVGAGLVNRLARGSEVFERAQDIFSFTLLAALASPVISATIGVTSLAVAGLATWPQYGSIWLTWWLGDVTGALIITPLLVLWVTHPRVLWSARQFAEAAALLAALLILALFVFEGLSPWSLKNYPLEFLVLPVVVWAAFRFGQREAITVTALLSGVAIWATLQGLGPFGRQTPSESLLLLQTYLGTAAITGLVLAALAAENVKLYRAARRQNADLEQRVQLGTSELLQSEARYKWLVNSIEDYAIVMLDRQGSVVSWNHGAERLLGYSPDEIIGENFARFYIPEDAGQGLPLDNLAMAAKKGWHEMEGWRMRKDGSRFWADILTSEVRNDAGEWIGFAKLTRDLTQRRQAEALIRDSEHRLAEAQHLARLGSLHCDLTTQIVTWSDELCQIYGVSPQAAPQTFEQFLDLVHADDRGRVEQVVRQALNDHQPFSFEHRIVRPDGTVAVLHGTVQFRVDAEGRPVALSATSQDISEHKQIEDDLRQSREQLRQLSAYLEHAREEERQRLSRELHDELGSTLTGLKLAVARIQRSLPEKTVELAGLLAGIDQAIQQVRSLATELRPAALEHFGLVAAIGELVKDFQRNTGIASQFATELEQVDLDDDVSIGVYRVVQESLTNIARHSGARTVTIRLAEEGESLILRIEDTGVGFVVPAKAWTGSLGLAGMRERVRAFAGQLVIDSFPGRGTTIVVTIPRSFAPGGHSPHGS